MHKLRLIKVLVLLVLMASPLAFAAEPDTSWIRSRMLGGASGNAFNPNISVIGDFVGNAGPMGDSKANKFSLREAELGLQATVDPYARADFFVAFPDGEKVELEEGYLTLLALPFGIRARGGKFLANFGRLNMIHSHELPQVNAPLALTAFLGAEGLKDTGVEISRSFAPLGIFTEISYSLLNGLGAEEEAEAVTTNVTDVNANVTTVTVKTDAAAAPRRGNSFAHVSRIRFYQDLTDATNVELGFSGALHEPQEGKKQAKLGGVDFTLRWKPVKEGLYHSFIWRSEFLYSARRLPAARDVLTGAIATPERELCRRGAYSYVEIQPLQRWKFGLRGDYVESPEAQNTVITYPDGSTRTFEVSTTRALAPYITFTLSEFNRLRLQYEYQNTSTARENEHRVFLQWTFILGAHGAHPF